MPLECELKVKDAQLYKACYCGLCHTLGMHYGAIARTALQYDCAFLAIVAASISPEQVQLQKRWCCFKPLAGKKDLVCNTAAFEYAAAINVLLAWHKFDDDVRDEHTLHARIARRLFARARAKAAAAYPMADLLICDALTHLAALERTGCTQADLVADAFAALVADLFRLCPNANAQNSEALKTLGYNIGRWIYLMDAWDDRQKDSKSGAYNVFVQSAASQQEASFMLHASLYESCQALARLSPARFGSILENILTLGCAAKTEHLLHMEEQNGPLSDSRRQS